MLMHGLPADASAGLPHRDVGAGTLAAIFLLVLAFNVPEQYGFRWNYRAIKLLAETKGEIVMVADTSGHHDLGDTLADALDPGRRVEEDQETMVKWRARSNVWMQPIREQLWLAASGRTIAVRAHGICGVGLQKGLDISQTTQDRSCRQP